MCSVSPEHRRREPAEPGKVVRPSYGGFDGIRGVAAIAVMLFHGCYLARFPDFVPSGYLAVDLFFMLSGFIIAHAYGDKLRHGMRLGEFVEIRARRLYPLYLLGQALGFLVFLGAALGNVDGYALQPLFMALLFGVLMLPVPVRGIGTVPSIMPLNGPSWSLFAEVAINVVYAIARPLLDRRVLWPVLMLGAFSLAIAARRWGNLHFGYGERNFLWGGTRVLFSFTAGLLIYEYRPMVVRHSNAVSMVLLSGTVLTLIAGERTWWYDLPVVYFLFPVLVWSAAVFQPAGSLASVFRWLGRVSYPIYILHTPFLFLVAIAIAPRLHDPMIRDAMWIGAMFAIVLLAHLLDRFYDTPIRLALSKKTHTGFPVIAVEPSGGLGDEKEERMR